MTIIVDNYLHEETFQYKDETTNWELADGGKWYFIKIDQLLRNELLHAGELENLQLNTPDVALPGGNGICYMGLGVQLEHNGKRYDMTAGNQSVVQEALRSGTAKWRWNRDRFLKYGGTGTATVDVFVVDKAGDRIPDCQLSVNKHVTK